MSKWKEIGVLGTYGDVQGDMLENNTDNNKGRSDTETVQLQSSTGNGTVGAVTLEPGVNDLPQQKGQTNVIKVVSRGGSIGTPLNMKEIVLKINGRNYTLYSKNI